MRTVLRPFLACSLLVSALAAQNSSPDEAMLRRIYSAALTRSQAHDNLRTLVTQTPGRLSGSTSLIRAVAWAEQTLAAIKPDRVYKQDVLVPHWERGAKESVALVAADGARTPLAALALGGSGSAPDGGLIASVIEVRSLDEVEKLGREKVAGKIVFFNRPMDPTTIVPGVAYFSAGDQRNRGPLTAAKHGAAGVLTRSLTHARDDFPHTGTIGRGADQLKIPCAALSTVAADRLSAALAASPALRVELKVFSRWLPDAPSHNVIGEIHGSESPDEIILVGGHLDCWDIAPGANDDGSGVVQAIEVLRLFRALGLKPRHTLRCVLFTNEENGLRGATAYAASVKERREKHLFAVESDAGSFHPRGFSLGSTQGDVHQRAARWLPLFAPYGIVEFRKGAAGAVVVPLMVQGAAVGEIINDSQRYFDWHHTVNDSLDKVSPRDLALGAAALAALIWLVDTQGL
ncbi:MAG: M20/M25/M40 family metallo-hydrolase [Verrucomicrobia bacterium]|nr:M20/M25/M40 family metallo-hydrolase [Verrucomicrobiota bacterium]